MKNDREHQSGYPGEPGHPGIGRAGGAGGSGGAGGRGEPSGAGGGGGLGGAGGRGATGEAGPRGRRGRSSIGEWVRWGLTMVAVAITLTSTAAWKHESDVRDRADTASLQQRDATDRHLAESIDANCAVLVVQLDSRADRDATAKLFGSIRRRDPKLFDKLIARAKLNDTKLLHASKQLSCQVPARIIRKLKG
jgi:hypothetical protein